MATNYGKQFEMQFRKDASQIGNIFVYRVPDQLSGYSYNSANPCDYIVYKYPKLFLVELKSIKGNTFNFAGLRQAAKLSDIKPTEGLNKIVIIWFRDHQKILCFDFETIQKMKDDGLKSININKLKDQGYNYIEIPTVKKRIFLTADYSVIFNIQNNEDN